MFLAANVRSLQPGGYKATNHGHNYKTVKISLMAELCSLAVLDMRVSHIMDVLSPFIYVLHHSDSPRLCCPSRPCVVFLARVHLAMLLALSFFIMCDHNMLAEYSGPKLS